MVIVLLDIEPCTKTGDLQISLFHTVQQHVDQIFIVPERKRRSYQPQSNERSTEKQRSSSHRGVCEGEKEETEETEVYREDTAQQSLDILGFSVQPLWLMTFQELTSEPQRSSPSVAEFPAGFPLIPEL